MFGCESATHLLELLLVFGMCGVQFCFRLAQAVLAREEPEETFLKSIPQQLASLQIIHPVRIRTPCQVAHGKLSMQAIWLHEPLLLLQASLEICC